MGSRWSTAQVLALAPDASSATAARGLASPGRWSGVGASGEPAAVWGDCQGSGKAPYRVAVALPGGTEGSGVPEGGGAAYQCSCPSRKIPCKHALALLLMLAAGEVPAAEPPQRVADWLAARAERADRAHQRAAAAAGRDGPADPEGARRRAEQRGRRMAAGLAELDRWLRDQVRVGIAGTERAGYGPFDALAARMVDAQLPGVASAVRRLASAAASGDGWPGRLLEEYALLHLLVAAAGGTAAADAGQAAADADAGQETVRAHLGVTVAKDDVLARDPVRDDWTVLGLRDEAEDRFVVRRIWLQGRRSGRPAVVLSFAATPGQQLDASLVPGTVVDADLHFYPGAAPLRALVGARHDTARRRPPGPVPGVGLDAALAAWAAVLAADPWQRSWPVVLADVVPVVDGEGWWLVDDSGALPLVISGEAPWSMLAVSGGHPVTLLGEVVPGGVRPVHVLAAGRPAEADAGPPAGTPEPVAS